MLHFLNICYIHFLVLLDRDQKSVLLPELPLLISGCYLSVPGALFGLFRHAFLHEFAEHKILRN